MKTFFLVSASLLIGYGLYPLVNPTTESPSEDSINAFRLFLSEEGQRYAQAASAEEKLKLADEMYEKMLILFLSQLELEGVKNKPVPNIEISVLPEKKIFVEVPRVPLPPLKEKELSIRDKIFSDKLDPRTFLTFANQPFLSPLDSRIVKLQGRFKGTLKNITGNSRTGAPEVLEMEVSQSLTVIEAQDNYDNETLSIKEPTATLFRTVPGDENLLMVSQGARTLIFDLKTFPRITGRLLVSARVQSELVLQPIKLK